MEPYQQRVIDERDELLVKIDKLLAFVTTSTFEQLPPDERDRLNRQLWLMGDYFEVLVERIEAFGKAPAEPPRYVTREEAQGMLNAAWRRLLDSVLRR